MMSYILGNEKFHEGVSNYLSVQEPKITTLDQVWNLFPLEIRDTTNNLPSSTTLKHIMDSWTIKKGHPQIEVTRDLQNQIIKIQQVSFSKLEMLSIDSQYCS